MIIKNKKQLKKYQEIGQLSTDILHELHRAVRPGATPLAINQLAEELCQKHKAVPSFKGVGPVNNKYQHAVCVSVNDTVVHGIPDQRQFKEGDVVKVDFGLKKDGLQTDHCFTLGLNQIKTDDMHLIRAAREAVQTAVQLAQPGNYTGDLGHTMQTIVEKADFNIAKEFTGHGIGEKMHEPPQIPAFGRPEAGIKLKQGMILCVEAQVLAGSDRIIFTDDGWTVKTEDGKNSAMFEYMVMVSENKPIILTPTLDWAIVK